MMSGMSDDPAALRNKAIPIATRCRLAYVTGVEERSLEATGRSQLTEEELRLALQQYPGDPADVAARYELERQGGRP
jgi:hypothetical protein